MQNQDDVEKGVEQNHGVQPQQGIQMQQQQGIPMQQQQGIPMQQQQGVPMQQQPVMVMAQQPGVVVGAPYYAMHDSSETTAIILLIVGFCVPCLWFVPVCLYGTKHPKRSTRLITIVSLVLAILSVIAWAIVIVAILVTDDSNDGRWVGGPIKGSLGPPPNSTL